MPPSSRIAQLANGNSYLEVDGSPFLIRGGELQNSSLSSSAYMAEVWPMLKRMNLNTVLGAVTWDQIEPVEGKFDFVELDRVIEQAREQGVKLVLLWFGAFKNGMSSYAPPWVKRDTKRFPRATVVQNGQRSHQNVGSLFHPNLLESDIRAFEHLIAHVKDTDEAHATVIMVQVENEVGLLGSARDRSPAADSVFNSPPPGELMSALAKDWSSLFPPLRQALSTFHTNGYSAKPTWIETFGSSVYVDEVFMSYHYASYIEAVTVAGKAVYDIPMYANVWLPADTDTAYDQIAPESHNQRPAASASIGKANETLAPSGGQDPGSYPSGGPTARVLDMWRICAPSIELLAPDLYAGDYEKICHVYRSHFQQGSARQPLFIPEQPRDALGARRIWSAFGTYGALGIGPFGIDTATESEQAVWTTHYGLLEQVTPQIIAARQQGQRVYGFFFDELKEGDSTAYVDLAVRTVVWGKWQLTVHRAMVFGRPGPGHGMMIELEHDPDTPRFLLVGEGFEVRFKYLSDTPTVSGILSFTEKAVGDHGELVTQRYLNGDEVSSVDGVAARMPAADPDYGDINVAVLQPARTRIAEVVPYYWADVDDKAKC